MRGYADMQMRISGMLKKLLCVSLLLFLFTNAGAQQYTQKDFIGYWKHYYKEKALNSYLVFESDTAQAIVSPGGLILLDGNYKLNFDADAATLSSHFYGDTESKSRDSKIKFLNDSTFLRVNSKKFPEKIDTTSNEILVYHKIKHTEKLVKPHLPTEKDLIGNWYMQFKKITDNHIIFTDEQNATFTFEDGVVRETTYKVDFTKRPFTIDFTFKGTLNTQEDILQFSGDDKIHMAGPLRGKRRARFTTFGGNVLYIKEPLAKKLILQGK